ncbi:MAG: 50S ribosomal protein L4 [Candidatus Magasanikbacteria bacterium]|jgi:large subunit ribosomal protein L4|nr:50S ribosomal protein L4 [Candidatus Magasanikbacteria bacterium]
MKLPVYNNQGTKSGELDAADEVFAVAPNKTLVHQVYLALEANARQPWAHTKTKGEVRGGGRKPWKQKGTGRARHGSTRSPIWKGGGVTFGPRNDRNFVQKVNRKMNKKAVTMCLSDKVSSDTLMVVEQMPEDAKTKTFATLRSVMPGVGKTTLVLVAGKDEKLALATRNMQRVDMQRAEDVNVVDLLHHQFVIASKEAVQALEARFNK